MLRKYVKNNERKEEREGVTEVRGRKTQTKISKTIQNTMIIQPLLFITNFPDDRFVGILRTILEGGRSVYTV
jgi:hypothetical protein